MSRTPAALTWLASNHSHLLGRIERLKRMQARLASQVAGHQQGLLASMRRLALVEARLQSLSKQATSNDDVSKMHPIPFDLDEIAPRKQHYNPPLLPRGSMSETVLATLWHEGGSATTDQILANIMLASGSAPENLSYVKKRLLIRLWNMVSAGKLRADNSTPRTRNRTWFLAERTPPSPRCVHQSH